MYNKKGFTLIELIISIGIASIVLILSYNILSVGLKGYSSTFKSFENQSNLRYAIETTNNAIRFSTVGFIVTEKDFKPEITDRDINGLVKPWNYIGLSSDKKSVVHYKYVESGSKGDYELEVLAQAQEGIEYNIKFIKPIETQESKIIRYILEIKKDGKSEFIKTEVEAINAIHVIDWSDVNNKSIALAYRTEETPEIYRKPVAAMAMVLDTSGSMNSALDGGTTLYGNPSRISLLKSTLNDSNLGLFSILEENDVFVSLVPFSNNANIPHKNYNISPNIDVSKFYNLKDEKNTLETMVNALTTDGGTNTGDGMRRAYFQLKDFNNQKVLYGLKSNQLVKNYVIILVDGVTTFGSNKVKSNFSYSNGRKYNYSIPPIPYMGNDSIREGYLMGSGNRFNLSGSLVSGYNIIGVGKGDKLDSNYGESYVEKVGELMKNDIDQAFVIGYSNKVEKGKYIELESLTSIARALKIKVKDNEASKQFKENKFVFVATDKDSLKEAFEKIGSYINEELWQIHGPKLNR